MINRKVSSYDICIYVRNVYCCIYSDIEHFCTRGYGYILMSLGLLLFVRRIEACHEPCDATSALLRPIQAIR